MAKKPVAKDDRWSDVESSGGFWAEGIEGWEKNKVVEGRVVRIRNIGNDEKPNFVADAIDGNGRVTWGVPAILKGYLDAIKKGAVVRVGCLGKITLKNGREAWDFKVQTRAATSGEFADPGPVVSDADGDDTGDDLPF
jgi:hypothetical protein